MIRPTLTTQNQNTSLPAQVDSFKILSAFRTRLHSLRSNFVQQLPSCLLTAAIVNLMLLVFSLKTWLSIFFFAMTLREVIRAKWELVRQKGLIHYMSADTQALLLHRSVFDVLCDLWFIPRLSIYFKALLMPLVVKIKPEQAMEQLAILPEADRRAVLTKGVVYVLPKRLRKILLPQSFELRNKIQEFFEEENEEEGIKYKPNSDHSNRKTLEPALGELDSQVERESTHCENHKSGDPHLPSVNLIPYIKKEIKRENSKVIISSKMLREMKELPGKMIDQWDNLSTYKLQKVEKNLRKKPSLSKKVTNLPELSDVEPEIKSPKTHSSHSLSPLSMVIGLVNLKKHKLFSRFSRRSLILIFSSSIVIFVLKLGVSSRYRRLTKNLLMTLSFLALVATGSASLLAITMHPSSETKKPILPTKLAKVSEN
jgi:hypothetical protein